MIDALLVVGFLIYGAVGLTMLIMYAVVWVMYPPEEAKKAHAAFFSAVEGSINRLSSPIVFVGVFLALLLAINQG